MTKRNSLVPSNNQSPASTQATKLVRPAKMDIVDFLELVAKRGDFQTFLLALEEGLNRGQKAQILGMLYVLGIAHNKATYASDYSTAQFNVTKELYDTFRNMGNTVGPVSGIGAFATSESFDALDVARYDHLTTAGRVDYDGRGDIPYNPRLDTYKPTYEVLPSYDALIDPATGRKKFEVDAGLKHTLATIKRAAKTSIPQVVRLAAHLKAPTVVQSCYNIFHFLKMNVKYLLDKPGHEQVRTAARSWMDRATGIDCEDFSIFAWTLAENMGFDPDFEVVAFNGLSQYGHIFIVVKAPANLVGRSAPYVIDVVNSNFDLRPPGISKTMRIETLSGMPQEIGSIHGLGASMPPSPLTRGLMARQTQLIRTGLSGGLAGPAYAGELRKIRYAIVLNGTEDQEFVMRILPHVRDISPRGEFLFKPGTDLAGLEGFIEGLEGKRKAEKKAKRQEKRAARQEKRAAKKAVRVENRTARKAARGEKRSNVKAQKAAVKTAKKSGNRAAVKTAKKELQTARGGNIIKRTGKAIAKYAPVTVAIRNSFLLAMKINFARIASRLKYSYLSADQARAKRINLTQHARLINARKKVEKLFVNMGGDAGNLRVAIVNGGGGLAGFMMGRTRINRFDSLPPNRSDIAGLGAAPAAAVAAAMPAITATLAILKEVDFKSLFEATAKKTDDESVAEVAEERVNATTQARPYTEAVRNVAETLPADPGGGYSDGGGDELAPPSIQDFAASEDEQPVADEVLEEITTDDVLEQTGEEMDVSEDDFSEPAFDETDAELNPDEELGSLVNSLKKVVSTVKDVKSRLPKRKKRAHVLNRRPERTGGKGIKKKVAQVRAAVKKLKAKNPQQKKKAITAQNKGYVSNEEQKVVETQFKADQMATQPTQAGINFPAWGWAAAAAALVVGAVASK